MSKYVSRVVCMRNGARVMNVKNFKKGEVVFREIVKTMDGPDTVDVSPDHTFSIDHVITKATPKIDWSEVENENWSFQLDGGGTMEYSGVALLKEGEMTVDFEKETVVTVSFHAKSRTIR